MFYFLLFFVQILNVDTRELNQTHCLPPSPLRSRDTHVSDGDVKNGICINRTSSVHLGDHDKREVDGVGDSAHILWQGGAEVVGNSSTTTKQKYLKKSKKRKPSYSPKTVPLHLPSNRDLFKAPGEDLSHQGQRSSAKLFRKSQFCKNAGPNEFSSDIGDNESNTDELSGIQVRAVLIPRPTSILYPLRFLSFLLINISLNACILTSGKPLEDAVRRILNMPVPDPHSVHSNSNGDWASRVTPLHTYVAKKTISCGLSSSGSKEMLPPKHLPSPLPLLGLFMSLLLYLGGTILIPQWIVAMDVWFNYARFDVHSDRKISILNNQVIDLIKMKIIDNELRNWFDKYEHGISSPQTKMLRPAVLVNSAGPLDNLPSQPTSFRRRNTVVCPLYLSPDNNYVATQQHMGSECHKKLQHPRRYYFELEQKRYYYDPVYYNSKENSSIRVTPPSHVPSPLCYAPLVSGGPTFHSTLSIPTLLSPLYTQGLRTRFQLEYAQQRYGRYSQVSIPVPKLSSAFVQRITSPVVMLQLVGRLLSMLEEESMGRSFTNLVRFAIQHWSDVKRSISNSITLANEIKEHEDTESDKHSKTFWAVRPVMLKGGNTTKKRKKGSKWVNVPPSSLLPGDVFLIASTGLGTCTTNGRKCLSGTVSKENNSLGIPPIPIPVDALLLEGTCLTEEAALTGESVPQAKVPLDFPKGDNRTNTSSFGEQIHSENTKLDIAGHHRSSCVFAGTKLLYSANDNVIHSPTSLCSSTSTKTIGVLSSLPPLPKELCSEKTFPAIFLTLRTGIYSSRGEIMHSLLKRRTNLGIVLNKEFETDSIRLVALLTMLSICACASLFIGHEGVESRDSVYKRIVQCTRIIASSVPSDLPISLSTSARACTEILRKDSDVVCSEPGSLLTSSTVDTVVFDKTGTLTTDTQSLISTVVPPANFRLLSLGAGCDSNTGGKKNCSTVNPFNQASYASLSNVVLAGGHALVGTSEEEDIHCDLIGDPLDIAALSYTGWRYNAREKNAVFSGQSHCLNEPVQLWQIRSFPFDPNKRLSSAIILVKNCASDFGLWIVTKGAPDSMRNILFKGFKHEKIQSWYDNEILRLGELGHRTVALGVLDVTDAQSFTNELFPSGLPSVDSDHPDLQEFIDEARHRAYTLFDRNHIEQQTANGLSERLMEFVGFACFDAPLRTSSRRVVKELKKAKMKICMLTGDEIHASFATASKAGIVSNDSRSKVYFLDTGTTTDNSPGALEWEVGNASKQFSLSILKNIERDVDSGNGTIVMSGKAIDALSLREETDSLTSFILQKLVPKTAVVAGASPRNKHTFIKWLQRLCNKHILMCGDGVNDVTAMKQADVSVGMLSGFRNEPAIGNLGCEDTEDIRRRERLQKRYIGSNRKLLQQSKLSFMKNAGLGDSILASRVRIQQRILGEYRRLKDRKGSANEQSKSNSPSFHETILGVSILAFKEELHRHRMLKKGGSGAAKILAEEERLRRSLLSKNDVDFSPSYAAESGAYDSEIKVGEASLASSFTLLRPCLSGVENILRAGVTAAAFGVSLFRKTSLNCMLACYNLATLYKDGFRYGKYMWQIELASIVSIESASFVASSTPRPRLVSEIRPSRSLFHPAEILSTTLQAVVHVVTFSLAVRAGKDLEVRLPIKTQRKGFRILWGTCSDNNDASAGSLMACLLGNTGLSTFSPSEVDVSELGFFHRSPFCPNHVANNVFIMSVFQNAVISLVNHVGKPFTTAFLENRSLCLSICAAFLFCIICITETFPIINRIIELAPFPSKSSQILMLRLLLFNISSCYFLEYLISYTLHHDVWTERCNEADLSLPLSKRAVSADHEEFLLSDEKKQNSLIVACVYVLIFFLVYGMIC